MKCAVALLFDREVENIVNELAWRAHLEFGVDLGVRRLPPHVSLKQPFSIGNRAQDLDKVLEGLALFSKAIRPFPISFSQLNCWETVLQYYVSPIEPFRKLHDELHEAMSAIVEDASAPFDGQAYTFHLTVAIGGPSLDAFQVIAEKFGAVSIPESVPTHLAAFVYDYDQYPAGGDYLTVRTWPLKSD